MRSSMDSCKENKQAKAAESFRAKEAQSLTKSIGTIDTISKPTQNTHKVYIKKQEDAEENPTHTQLISSI